MMVIHEVILHMDEYKITFSTSTLKKFCFQFAKNIMNIGQSLCVSQSGWQDIIPYKLLQSVGRRRVAESGGRPRQTLLL
jgi:hypothetical protein